MDYIKEMKKRFLDDGKIYIDIAEQKQKKRGRPLKSERELSYSEHSKCYILKFSKALIEQKMGWKAGNTISVVPTPTGLYLMAYQKRQPVRRRTRVYETPEQRKKLLEEEKKQRREHKRQEKKLKKPKRIKPREKK